MLVASTGGHLAQLHALAPRITGLAPEDRTWVTFDTPQSRSLLSDEVEVVYVAYTAPRDWRNAARNLPVAWRLARSGRFGQVVSTGSGIALSFLPLARAHGIDVTYIESAARGDGPSLTGRLLARVPGTRLGTQYRVWSDDRWRYVGSVLDAYAAEDRENRLAEPRRILVTLGTIPYGFRRLVECLVELLPADVQVTWQVGATDVSGLPIESCTTMPGDQLGRLASEADVVIAHAGTGSALMALERGRCPILVPRERRHDEHVDDHQAQIAAELAQRGLAIQRSVDQLTWEDVRAAAGARIRRAASPPALTL